MTKKIVGAKIACLDFSLNKVKMKLGVQVLIEDPSKLEGIRQRSVAFLIMKLITLFDLTNEIWFCCLV